jgi:hypothetical protein
MRISYALAVAGLLAGGPAMAQVVIATPGNSSSAHDYQADQDRAAGHQNMDAARANAAVGNYGAAAQDKAAAREDMHAARHEEHAADRDASGAPGAPVILEVR